MAETLDFKIFTVTVTGGPGGDSDSAARGERTRNRL